MTACVFCRIVSKDLPSTVVWEDDLTVAFMDIGSVNPGHVLVASRKHAENLCELDEALAAAVSRTTVRMARAVNAVFAPEGISIYQANGRAAGQTVFHFHVHIVPRYEGDGMQLVWPAKNPARAELEQTAQQLRSAL
jgi:histidine triad (HIT) family protein